MKAHFERVNNRYRGPFEKNKLYFLFNQIGANLTSINYKSKTMAQKAKNSAKEIDNTYVYRSINRIYTDAYNILEELNNLWV